MATTQVVKVKVEELSKFGYKANGKYVGLSKNLSEGDKTKLVPGAEFEAEYYIADSGKEYLNKILSINSTPSIPLEQAAKMNSDTFKASVDTARAKHFTPKFIKKEGGAESNAMSKADWAQKDRNMMIGGRSHDAAVIVAALINVTAVGDNALVLKTYKEILEGMLAIAEEVK